MFNVLLFAEEVEISLFRIHQLNLTFLYKSHEISLLFIPFNSQLIRFYYSVPLLLFQVWDISNSFIVVTFQIEVYQLRSIVIHRSFGHYLALVRVGEDFVEVDDQLVHRRVVLEPEVIGEESTMLFYEKVWKLLSFRLSFSLFFVLRLSPSFVLFNLFVFSFFVFLPSHCLSSISSSLSILYFVHFSFSSIRSDFLRFVKMLASKCLSV